MSEDGVLQFTNDHYIALGKVLVAFQSLELGVALALSRLMQPKPQQFIEAISGFEIKVLMELPFKKRLTLIRHFIQTLPESDKPRDAPRKVEFDECIRRLDDAVSNAFKAEQTRNTLVHSHWIGHGKCGIQGGATGIVMRAKFSANRAPDSRSVSYVTAQNILELAESIETSGRALSESAEETALHIAYTREIEKN